MRKAILIGSAMVVLAAVVFAGNNDPWKSKPYQQWDDKDIRRDSRGLAVVQDHSGRCHLDQPKRNRGC